MSDNSDWGEKQRERFYWRVALVLLVSTPALIALSYQSYSRLPIEGAIFSPLTAPYFIVLGIGSIILPMLFELAVSRERKLWIKYPEVTVEHRVEGSYEEWVRRHGELLSEAGFAVIPTGQPSTWQILKTKKRSVHAFGDHAFSGVVTISNYGFGTIASLALKFEDIVLIETGEIAKTRALAATLLGDAPDVLDEPGVPLTVLTAVVLGAIAHLSAYAGHLIGHGIHLPIFEASFLSTGEAVWMTIVVLLKGKQVIGLRIAGAMIFAGAAPFLALALGKMMGP